MRPGSPPRSVRASSGDAPVAVALPGCGTTSGSDNDGPHLSLCPGRGSQGPCSWRPVRSVRARAFIRAPTGAGRSLRAPAGTAQPVHVEVFAANRVVIVPAGIGVRPPLTFSAGRIIHAHCYGTLVTLEPTGVVLVRAASASPSPASSAPGASRFRPRDWASFDASPGRGWQCLSTGGAGGGRRGACRFCRMARSCSRWDPTSRHTPPSCSRRRSSNEFPPGLLNKLFGPTTLFFVKGSRSFFEEVVHPARSQATTRSRPGSSGNERCRLEGRM